MGVGAGGYIQQEQQVNGRRGRVRWLTHHHSLPLQTNVVSRDESLAFLKQSKSFRTHWTLVFRMVGMGLPYFVDSSVYDGVLVHKMEFWAWTQLGWAFDGVSEFLACTLLWEMDWWIRSCIHLLLTGYSWTWCLSLRYDVEIWKDVEWKWWESLFAVMWQSERSGCRESR